MLETLENETQARTLRGERQREQARLTANRPAVRNEIT